MDHPNEIDYDVASFAADVDPAVIEMIRVQERTKIFSKLRSLIHEKESEGDSLAANVLGWAYENLADQ
mgnify:CR=1 FL=1|jgi:hypothetical protein